MRKFSGNKEILDSGLVISFRKESLLFELSENMRITFSFVDNDSEKGHRIESKSINSNELELVLINFNNSLGTGTTEPIPIGTVSNRRLYLNFIVYSLGKDTQKIFQYTWYLEEEVHHA